jgi:hypothetical protein
VNGLGYDSPVSNFQQSISSFCPISFSGAVVVDKMSTESGAFTDLKEPPIVYHFGRTSTDKSNLLLYSKLVETLGEAVLDALDRNLAGTP